MSKEAKIKVLFVGSFLGKTKTGGVGGQMFASKTITESKLSERIEWIKLDTTALNNIKTPLHIRVFRAVLRIIKFVFHILFSRVDKVLIFTGSGASFKEKGLMALIAKFFGKYVIIAPRSGAILNDFESKNKKFIEKVFTKTDVVICQSESWKNTFEKEFPHLDKNKFKVIYNALDITKYNISSSPKNNLVPEIVFIAWVDRNKGVYELIEAVEILKKEGFKFSLTMCGHGKDFDAIKILISDKKLQEVIDLKGWIYEEEKNEILKRADIFVLPTYNEGMPNALLEAMASALPSVATSVGAIPDILQNEVSGLLIPSADSLQLAEALKKLLMNASLRQQYGAAARKQIEQKHSVDGMIARYSKMFWND